MENFEYIVEEFPYGSLQSIAEFELKLNELSKEGWELTTSQLTPFRNPANNQYGMVCIFKRKKIT
jgi:hypothetical protein